MKFVCDRCKTRYSIGDDRVRGKILKIRCKNCANVITVREGMTADEPADAEGVPNVATQRERSQPNRAQKKTTLAPAAAHSAPAPAPQSAKPPAALDEEWYVSIDGEQSGPFSLADAQRWVGGKSFEAELHCWTEGFDDWLAVDKVSHFRGLRRKPVAQSPTPPLPRVPQRAPSQAARARVDVEEEPKPLFAATMASLESAAPRPVEPARPKATPPAGVPSVLGGATARPNGGAPAPIAAKNGKTGPVDALAGTASGAQPARPTGSGTGTANALGRPTAARDRTGPENVIPGRPNPAASPQSGGRVPTRPGVGRPVPGFDAGPAMAAAGAAAAVVEDDESGKTHIEAPPFVEPAGSSLLGAPSSALGSVAPFTRQEGLTPPREPTNDDDMEIGEVSRVVNLADLSRTPRSKDRAQPVRRPSFRVGSVTEATPQAALGVDGGVAPDAAPGLGYAPGFDGQAYPGAMLGTPDLAAEVPLAPAPPVNHRRSLVALLVVAILLVGGAAGVVVYIGLKGDDTPLQLADHNQDVDSTRPDDPNYHPPTNPENPTQPPHEQHLQYPRPHYPTGPLTPPDKGSNATGPDSALKPEEVEDKYNASNSLTQRCWERAQKKDPFIVKDVKRVVVTLTVAADGGVGNVTFAGLPPDDSLANLGPCLNGIIRKWYFRPTHDGLTAKITMAFQ